MKGLLLASVRTLTAVFLGIMLTTAACALPRSLTLHEQAELIRNQDIQLRVLSLEAFLDVWGAPTYEDRQRTQFYVVDGGSWVPQFRVPLGESPLGWNNGITRYDAYFLGYADRGELLGFVSHQLMYRERLPPEQIHAIGKSWQKEKRFRTTLEKSLQSER